jgi:hypothetical protein
VVEGGIGAERIRTACGPRVYGRAKAYAALVLPQTAGEGTPGRPWLEVRKCSGDRTSVHVLAVRRWSGAGTFGLMVCVAEKP